MQLSGEINCAGSFSANRSDRSCSEEKSAQPAAPMQSSTPPAPFGFLHGYVFSLSRKSAAHSVIHRRSGSILSALSAL